MTFEFDETYEEERFKRLQIWLKENVVVIPEPQAVTLFDFEISWESWRGSFKVKFDDEIYAERLEFSIGITGYPHYTVPSFTSPLGVPASYAAMEMTASTRDAITRALNKTLPKFKPLGRNRETGIEITYQTPMSNRIDISAIRDTKETITKHYSITIPILLASVESL